MLDRVMEKFITQEVSYGELMEVAMSIAYLDDKPMRDAFVKAYADMIQAVNDDIETFDEAVNVVKENLGYLCGYYDQATASMMYDFYDMAHPIFGRNKPTTEEAIELGVAWAKENL